MTRTFTRLKSGWEDRYRQPTSHDLTSAIVNKQTGALFETARQRLLALGGVRESLSWQGVAWRWTFVYRRDEDGTTRPLAYLIPDPARPQIVVPLAAEAVDAVRVRRLSKPVRDRIVHATQVNGVRWTQFELASKTQLEEVLELAAAGYSLLAESA